MLATSDQARTGCKQVRDKQVVLGTAGTKTIWQKESLKTDI